YNNGSLTVSSCTISGNTAVGGFGGGINNRGPGGTFSASKSTISGNMSDLGGGGIFNNGAGTIRKRTIAADSSPNSTGGLEESGGSLNTGNTIIAGNAGVVPDISGNLGSQGYNLIGDGTGGTGFISTDLVGVNPLLSPLGDYAGPTATVALLP